MRVDPHYNRTTVAVVGVPRSKKPHGSVNLYQSKDEATVPYDVIAIMSVEGSAGEEAAFIKAFLYHAADLGADGVIFSRVSLASGTKGGGWIIGQSGGFGLPVNPAQDAVYRGEAIHLR